MENVQSTANLVLKAVALGMAVVSVVLGILGAVDVSAQVTLLGIGLFALALLALRNEAQADQARKHDLQRRKAP